MRDMVLVQFLFWGDRRDGTSPLGWSQYEHDHGLRAIARLSDKSFIYDKDRQTNIGRDEKAKDQVHKKQNEFFGHNIERKYPSYLSFFLPDVVE
jgi:hypothetical protein